MFMSRFWLANFWDARYFNADGAEMTTPISGLILYALDETPTLRALDEDRSLKPLEGRT